MWFLALDHVTMKNDARWTTIKAELQRETEAIFHRSGEVLLLDSVEKSDFELTVTSETGQLKITYVHERNAVRWETEKELSWFSLKWRSDVRPTSIGSKDPMP